MMDLGLTKEIIQLISDNLLELEVLNMERHEGSSFIEIVLQSVITTHPSQQRGLARNLQLISKH